MGRRVDFSRVKEPTRTYPLVGAAEAAPLALRRSARRAERCPPGFPRRTRSVRTRKRACVSGLHGLESSVLSV